MSFKVPKEQEYFNNRRQSCEMESGSNANSSILTNMLMLGKSTFSSSIDSSDITCKRATNSYATTGGGYEEIDSNSCCTTKPPANNISITSVQPPTTIGSTSSSSLSNSLWELKDNLFSGISSRIGAALSTPPPQQTVVKKQPPSSHWVTTKDRSVFGQPEIRIDVQSPTSVTRMRGMNKESSHESLDTLDSGHSLGSGKDHNRVASLDLGGLEFHDSLKSYCNESVGIGSSLESSDVEEYATDDCNDNSCIDRSESRASIQSWLSSSNEESCKESFDAKNFMEKFVQKMFHSPDKITLDEKSKFGEMVRNDMGRSWFCRYITDQRVECKAVEESTFYSLVQHFAIILFECSEVDDFTPAKIIMNMSFTYFHWIVTAKKEQKRQYVYECLKEQPIWRSLRFWTAAFFDSVQSEREKNCINKGTTRLQMQTEEEVRDEEIYIENITFGQLGTFTHNMKEFGLSKEFCIEFLRKQSTIANLRKEQYDIIHENIDLLYSSSNNIVKG